MKGDYNGECYRGVCTNKPATYLNSSTRHYYCPGCARRINGINGTELCRHVEDPHWKDIEMPQDYTCCCGLYVHPERQRPDAIHMLDCPYAAPG